MGDQGNPVHVFSGHSSAVKGFDWRIQSDSSSSDISCQLVSFANDDHLRLWAIDAAVRQACTGTPLRTKNKPSNSPDFAVLDLGQEFHLIKAYGIPGVNIQEMDLHSRQAVVGVDGPGGTCYIKIGFPAMYPRNAAPSFEFLPLTTFPINVQANLRKVPHSYSRDP